jgi:hypothetical protein
LTIDKTNPTITKIALTDEQKEDISCILNGTPRKQHIAEWQAKGYDIQYRTKGYRPGHPKNRLKLIREMYKVSTCCLCSEISSVKLSYKLPDITLVEYYCDQHLPKL